MMNKGKSYIVQKTVALKVWTAILFYYIVGCIVRLFFKVKKGRVLLWSDAFSGYSCNPKAISDYILANNLDYDVYWAFQYPRKYTYLDKRIHIVHKMSIKFVYIINTAQFIITNHRTYPFQLGWKKRNVQRYVMTWHGTMGVKKVGLEKKLPKRESKIIRIDSSNCDLMMTDSRWFEDIIRNAIGYYGPVLTEGMPRNDIYFDVKRREVAVEKVHRYYNIPKGNKIVLYAPTFRKDLSTSNYFADWDAIMDSLKMLLGGDISVIVRYHPDLKRYNPDALNDVSYGINATSYDDMQELLCAADLLVTDYSSTMFDMGLMKKPCILYASDVDEYDRGLNFDLRKLPMPLVESTEDFKNVLDLFDKNDYLLKIDRFYNDVFKVYNGHNGCESFCKWMAQQ